MERPEFEDALVLPVRVVRRGGAPADAAGVAASGVVAGDARGGAGTGRAVTVEGPLRAVWGLWDRLRWLSPVWVAEAQEEEELGRRIGLGGQELSASEELRLLRFGAATRELRALEPRNRMLSTVADPKSVPTEAWVGSLEAELRRAQARAAAKQEGRVGVAAEDGDGLSVPLRWPELEPGPTRQVLEALMPDGKLIGGRAKGAEVRTVTPEEFERLRTLLMSEFPEAASKPGYRGRWYRISKDLAFGLRNSKDYGQTIDFQSPYLLKGLKVHQR